MAKKGEVSIFHQQKLNKPRIDDLVNALPDGEVKKRGIDFLKYLKQLRMNPSWYSTNSYNTNYKGKRVNIIRVNYGAPYDQLKNKISISCYLPDDNLFDILMSEQPDEVRKMVLDCMSRCRSCQPCAPGKDRPILGKEAINLCKYSHVHFSNPNEQQYELVKRLIELRRESIRVNTI